MESVTREGSSARDMSDYPVTELPPLPRHLRFLAGGGQATRLILKQDWSDHPLGEPGGWSEALKATLSTVLNSPESMILAWGRDELTFFFNETYFPLLGPRLEWAMGAPFREVWADAWEQAEPIIRNAFAGYSQRFTDLPWKLNTDRGQADTWFTFSYPAFSTRRARLPACSSSPTRRPPVFRPTRCSNLLRMN